MNFFKKKIFQDESEQGRIQGALYSLQALASGVGPILLRIVYSQTKNSSFFGPGFMFIFAGGLYLIAVGIACALPKELANSSRRRRDSSNGIDEEDDEDDVDYIPLYTPDEETASRSSYGSV